MEWSDANVEAALRTEIIESQRSQAEFLKWKLLSVAALGALALSFRRAAEPEPTFWSGLDLRLLLCLVPVICAYVVATNFFRPLQGVAKWSRAPHPLPTSG